MHIKRIINATVCFFIVVIPALLLCEYAAAQEFKADLISSTKEGVFQGRIYCGKEKMRMELQGAITITRIDLNKVWMLIPREKKYMQLPMEPQNLIMGIEKHIPGEIDRKLIATETLNGILSDKYEVLYNLDEKERAVFIWIAKNLDFPVKSQAVDGSWSVEYRNVILAKQPDDLFEIPADFEQFSYGMPFMPDK